MSVIDSAATAPSTRTGCAMSLRAPGRLHIGFLDPAGSLGRPWGSVGLVIDGFETQLELRHTEVDAITAAPSVSEVEIERVRAHLAALRRHSGLGAAMHLHLRRVLPAHAGFGSGTQLALAVGRAFARWHGIDVATAELARWLDRGRRSGVGIAGFDQGGLLVDGGPGPDGTPASLLSRLPLPEAWRIVLVLDTTQRGLSGVDEKRALVELPPLPRSAAADICHQVLMRVLPGAASADFITFALGVSHMQRVLGEHFAAAQGGSAYTSPAVARMLQFVAARTPAATGQSSWGPTGFAVLPTQAAAEAAVADARAAGVVDSSLDVHIVRGRNHGAVIELSTAADNPT